MRVGGWRAQQRQIQGAAPGPLCRSLWNPGWFQPSFWSHPRHRSGGHKTVGCRLHPPFLSGCPLSPGTEEGEEGMLSATEKIFSELLAVFIFILHHGTNLICTKVLWTYCKCWDLPWSSQAFQWLGLSLNVPWQERIWCWHWRSWTKPRIRSWV